MKTSWLRQLALLALHSTHSTVLATGLQTARNVLQSPTARSTQYARATVLDTRPERTSAPSRLRIQPRQDTISTTEKPAVIVTEGYTIAAFPPYLCGFIDGDPGICFILDGSISQLTELRSAVLVPISCDLCRGQLISLLCHSWPASCRRWYHGLSKCRGDELQRRQLRRLKLSNL